MLRFHHGQHNQSIAYSVSFVHSHAIVLIQILVTVMYIQKITLRCTVV